MKDSINLKSQRLSYQPIADSHLHFIDDFLSCPEQTRYLPLGKPYPREKRVSYFEQRLVHWRNNQFGTFVFSLQDEPEPIGYCGLEYVRETECVDIRYGVKKELWGKGYGREAALWCLGFGFHQAGLQTIYGAAEHGNASSLAILTKLGMSPCNDVDFYGDVVQYFKIVNDDFDSP